MGIGAGVDYGHNDIKPPEAREEIGNRVVVGLREEQCRLAQRASDGDAPLALQCRSEVVGQLDAATQTRWEGEEGQVGSDEWTEVCVGGERIPGANVTSVKRAERSSSGFWIGTGVGAAVDVALVVAVAVACSHGCFTY